MRSPTPLRRYLSLQFLAVAGIPMLVIALLAWLYALPSMQTATTLQHHGLARAISGQITAHLEGSERQLSALADYIGAHPMLTDSELTALLDAQCGPGDLFEAIYLSRGGEARIDTLGLASARRGKREDLLGIDLSGRRFIHDLGQQRGMYWSETFLSTASSRLAVALTIALGEHEFLAAEITLDRLSELVSHLPLEAGYRILAVDGRGRVVADSQRTRWGQRLDISRLPHGGTAQQSPESGAFELDGARLLGTVVEIPGPGWRVVVAQSEARVRQPLRNTLTTIAIGLVIALGLALTIAWLQAGRLSNLFRSYAELAQSIALGRYDSALPDAKTTEFVHLGDSLERMARKISERERALIDSEQRLGNLVSNVPGLVFEFDVDRDNYRHSRFTGVAQGKAQEILGIDTAPTAFFETFQNCVVEEERERFVQNARTAIEQAKPWNFENRFVRPDGREIWVSCHAVPQERGERLTFYGVLMDVTRRKRTEESLHITQFSFDAASIGIFRIGEEARIIEVNRQACSNLGYTRDELCHMRVFDIDPDFDPEIWPDHIARLRQTGSKTLETRHRRKNGEIFPVEILINLMIYEGKEYHLAFVQDITQRKRAVDELHRAQAYTLNIINSMPSLLIGVDSAGLVTHWNSESERASGITARQACGRPLPEMLPWITPQLERFNEAVRSRQVISESKRSRRVDGALRYEDITIYPLAGDGVEGAVIRIDDVTRQVQMEELMIQSEKMLTVGGLAAGMAHEINNPLAGMLQTAHVMANRLGASLDNPANLRAAGAAGVELERIDRYMRERGIHRMITSINDSGQRIAALVENMLGLARKSDAEVGECRIEEIIDKTLELAAADYDLKKHYDFRSISIDRNFTLDLPAVPCQSPKIQQVLLNLFGNSAQAMHNGGTSNPRLAITTWLDRERDMVCVSVEDNGPGMDESTRKRVFEPFFTTKAKGAGTGLGLSVSYFIVTENHKGDILVESTPGQGAKFTLRLPCHPA